MGRTALRAGPEPRGQRGTPPLRAILVCDRDAVFREALRNFLLAAGQPRVEVAGTVRGTLRRLRHGRYRHVLLGISRPLSSARRLATVARRRQPEARIVLLVSAEDQPLIEETPFECVIKEYVFSNLLDLI